MAGAVVVVVRFTVVLVVGVGAAVVGVEVTGGELGDGVELVVGVVAVTEPVAGLGAAVVGVDFGATVEAGLGAVVVGALEGAGVAASVVGTGTGSAAAGGSGDGSPGDSTSTSTADDVDDPSAPGPLGDESTINSDGGDVAAFCTGCFGGAVRSIHAASAAAVVVDNPIEMRRAPAAGKRRRRRGAGVGDGVSSMPKPAVAAVPVPVGREEERFTRSAG